MEIENIKRWQWAIVGALLGFGFWNFWSGTDLSDVRQYSQAEFEQALVQKDRTTGEPLLQSIVVGPAEPDFRTLEKLNEARRREKEAESSDAGRAAALRAEAEKLKAEADKIRVNIVRFKRVGYHKNDPKQKGYIPGQFIAQLPYKPTMRAGTNDPNLTVQAYLDSLAKQYNHIQYRTDFWTKGPLAMSIWIGAGVLVIGGIWPTLINLMVGAGFGPKREPKDKKQKKGYFDRFSSAPEPARQAVATGPTDADRKRLDDINKALELELDEEGMGITSSPAATATDLTKAQAAQIRKLEGGPVEAAPVQQQSEEDVEYKGDWYPVAHKKHHEEEKPH